MLTIRVLVGKSLRACLACVGLELEVQGFLKLYFVLNCLPQALQLSSFIALFITSPNFFSSAMTFSLLMLFGPYRLDFLGYLISLLSSRRFYSQSFWEVAYIWP